MVRSYIVCDEIFLISVFVVQSVSNTVLSSVVSPPFLFGCLSVSLSVRKIFLPERI
jgi:hypothetical protein